VLHATQAAVFLGITLLIAAFARARETSGREARRHAARLEAMFGQASLGISLLSPGGRLTRVNRRMADIVGRSIEDTVGLTCQQITHPDDWPSHARLIEKVAGGALNEIAIDKRYLRPDGSSVWVHVSMAPLLDGDGEPEGLIAIVREMRANIIRASYSSVIYEMDDFSCALFGPDGQLVAQWWDHPGHVLPLPWGVRCAFDDFKDDIHPGDVLLLNDPYRGGTHLNDVTVIFPVFTDTGQMMIFPAVRAHWVDVGGMVPGSYSGLSTNIYQEGVRIPPIKIWERGVPNRAAMTLLMANMRIPVEREGDLNASIGSCRIAAERVRKLVHKHGQGVVSDCIRIHLDRTERRLRARHRWHAERRDARSAVSEHATA